MLIFNRKDTNPYFNLAAEEYFIRNCAEDIFMVWQNTPSVIIGKHQNAYAEANVPFLEQHNIPLIRRISGGGTVFHDLGNINFTFIRHLESNQLADFKIFNNVIIDFLHQIGLQAIPNERNSLTVNGNKISGNAEHIYHKKVLFHGTLLFNTDLKLLDDCLLSPKKYNGKSMPSVRSKVCNIIELQEKVIDINTLKKLLINYISERFISLPTDDFTLGYHHQIQQLVETKYHIPEWNFGYSPPYSFDIAIDTHNGKQSATCRIKDGKFETIDIQIVKSTLLAEILKKLQGITYNAKELSKFAEKYHKHLEPEGVTFVNLVSTFLKDEN
jgi:lipoate-protein ligase A